ncbi:MAG: hypothetical protein HXK66_01640 [Clostridiales bacterium]|nr:hypothetical protein [Clostridiales bacterium]
MGLKQQIKKFFSLFFKNKKLMINENYSDNEIVVNSMDDVENKIINRVMELNERENKLEEQSKYIFNGKWLFSINDEIDFDDIKILDKVDAVLGIFHNKYVDYFNNGKDDIKNGLIEFKSDELSEGINEIALYIGNNLNHDIDFLELKRNFVEKCLELEDITDELQKIISEKEGIRLELIKTLDKTSLLPSDEIFDKYGSAREYITNERNTVGFRKNLEYIARKYSLNEKSEEEFIDSVEEKVYFIDEIREVTRKFNGKKNDYREISKEENNLTKIQYDKLKLIISNFNNGKENVEKVLVGRKHKLFVMLDKLDLIIKKGDKLLNGINSVSNCSLE